MRSFFSFFIKHHFILLFIVLQIINLVLIISFNQHQRTIFISSSNQIAGSIESNTNEVKEYFALKNENAKLLAENTKLKNQQFQNYQNILDSSISVIDSTINQRYEYKPAKVIQTSIYKTRNYLTINIGKKQGVSKNDAVIAPRGVVGIVKKTSENFSVVLPIINSDFNLSCKINRNGYFGSLVWSGNNHRVAKLNDIPLHIQLHKSDSLFTTGYSLLFPSDVFVGTIQSFQDISGESFYDINVNLSVDFQNIQSVYVVSNLFKAELDSLLMLE